MSSEDYDFVVGEDGKAAKYDDEEDDDVDGWNFEVFGNDDAIKEAIEKILAQTEDHSEEEYDEGEEQEENVEEQQEEEEAAQIEDRDPKLKPASKIDFSDRTNPVKVDWPERDLKEVHIAEINDIGNNTVDLLDIAQYITRFYLNPPIYFEKESDSFQKDGLHDAIMGASMDEGIDSKPIFSPIKPPEAALRDLLELFCCGYETPYICEHAMDIVKAIQGSKDSPSNAAGKNDGIDPWGVDTTEPATGQDGWGVPVDSTQGGSAWGDSEKEEEESDQYGNHSAPGVESFSDSKVQSLTSEEVDLVWRIRDSFFSFLDHKYLFQGVYKLLKDLSTTTRKDLGFVFSEQPPPMSDEKKKLIEERFNSSFLEFKSSIRISTNILGSLATDSSPDLPLHVLRSIVINHGNIKFVWTKINEHISSLFTEMKSVWKRSISGKQATEMNRVQEFLKDSIPVISQSSLAPSDQRSLDIAADVEQEDLEGADEGADDLLQDLFGDDGEEEENEKEEEEEKPIDILPEAVVSVIDDPMSSIFGDSSKAIKEKKLMAIFSSRLQAAFIPAHVAEARLRGSSDMRAIISDYADIAADTMYLMQEIFQEALNAMHREEPDIVQDVFGFGKTTKKNAENDDLLEDLFDGDDSEMDLDMDVGESDELKHGELYKSNDAYLKFVDKALVLTKSQIAELYAAIPALRTDVKQKLMSDGLLDTNPKNAKSADAITSLHRYMVVKRLKNVPLSSLSQWRLSKKTYTLFTLVAEAVDKKFLNVDIHLPNQHEQMLINEIHSEINQAGMNYEQSRLNETTEVGKLRHDVVRAAVELIRHESIQNIKKELYSDSQNAIATVVRTHIETALIQEPYSISSSAILSIDDAQRNLKSMVEGGLFDKYADDDSMYDPYHRYVHGLGGSAYEGFELDPETISQGIREAVYIGVCPKSAVSRKVKERDREKIVECPTTFVAVQASSGRFIDRLELPFFAYRKQRRGAIGLTDRERGKIEDDEKLKKWIRHIQPSAIFVGSCGPSTRLLVEDLRSIVMSLSAFTVQEEDHGLEGGFRHRDVFSGSSRAMSAMLSYNEKKPHFILPHLKYIDVQEFDLRLANIVAASTSMSLELPTEQLHVKLALCIARYAVSPLCLASAVCAESVMLCALSDSSLRIKRRAGRGFSGFKQNISSNKALFKAIASISFQSLPSKYRDDLYSFGKNIHFHPAQYLLSSENLIHSIERSMVNCVRLHGIRINSCLVTGFGAGLVAFLPGFGPLRAFQFLTMVLEDYVLCPGRTRLFEEKYGAKSRRIFDNFCSFILTSSEVVPSDIVRCVSNHEIRQGWDKTFDDFDSDEQFADVTTIRDYALRRDIYDMKEALQTYLHLKNTDQFIFCPYYHHLFMIANAYLIGQSGEVTEMDVDTHLLSGHSVRRQIKEFMEMLYKKKVGMSANFIDGCISEIYDKVKDSYPLIGRDTICFIVYTLLNPQRKQVRMQGWIENDAIDLFYTRQGAERGELNVLRRNLLLTQRQSALSGELSQSSEIDAILIDNFSVCGVLPVMYIGKYCVCSVKRELISRHQRGEEEDAELEAISERRWICDIEGSPYLSAIMTSSVGSEDICPGKCAYCTIKSINYSRQNVDLELIDRTIKTFSPQELNRFNLDHLNKLTNTIQWLDIQLEKNDIQKKTDILSAGTEQDGLPEWRRKELLKQKVGQTNYVTRSIRNPNFSNVSVRKALDWLACHPQDSYLFRPSRSGCGYVVLCMKLFQFGPEGSVIVDFKIKEDEKDDNNPLTLGKKLYLRGQTREYPSLDAISKTFVRGIMEAMRDISSHKKFQRSQSLAVGLEELHTRKETNYVIFADDRTHSGKFGIVLTAPSLKKPVVEFFYLIGPKFLLYRNKRFEKLNQLISFFKKSFKKPFTEKLVFPDFGKGLE